MPIRTKLLAYTIICSILPLILVFYMSYVAARDSLNVTAEHNLFSQAEQELQSLQLAFANAKHDLVTLGGMGIMQDVVSGDATGALQRDIDLFASRGQMFREVLVVAADGTVVASTDRQFLGRDFSGSWEFEAPMLGIDYDGPVSTSYRLRQKVASQSIPIYADGSKEIIGALIGSIDWGYFVDILKALPVYGSVQNAQHQIVLESVFDHEVLYHTENTDVASHIILMDGSHSAAEHADQDSAGGFITRLTDTNNSDLMLSVSSIEFMGFRDPGWRMHFRLDAEALYADAYKLRDHYIMAGAVIFLLVMLLGWLLGQSIIKPVNKLLTGATKLAKGDYDFSIGKGGRYDEIGKLTNSFESMRKAVKENEEELVNKSEVAENAARLKGEFLANMSHEVRTPINGVLGMTELLLNTELDSTQSRYAETISRSGQSLLSVINDILDFSKIEAGKLELQEGAFDLRDLVEDVVEILAESAHKKGLELALHMPPESHVAFNGDASRLRQILINLMGNAVKFTSEGEVRLHVACRDLENGESELHFRVADSGIGIAESKLDSIFDSFVQADGTTTRQFGGTGLGLAISARLAELMGGTIGVQSKLGDGSVFWFTAQVVKLSTEVEAIWRTPDALVGKHVLIVDDNRTNREILESQLGFWGAEPHVTSSGQEALHEIKVLEESGQRFDAAILDMHMPGMSGLELAVALQDDGLAQDTRLILLSSMCDQLDMDTCRSVGITSMITKPVRQPDLYNCLTAIIGTDDKLEVNSREVARKIQSATLQGKVLLAEDNPVNQDMMMELLRLLGITAVLAENGQEAMDLLESQDFDLVLMDCQMPVMDGFTATREIRKLEAETGGKHMPIVALTANALQGDKERCLDSGMDEYLSKPVSSQQLRDMLDKVINGDELEGSGIPVDVDDANEPVSELAPATITLDSATGAATPAANSQVKPISVEANAERKARDAVVTEYMDACMKQASAEQPVEDTPDAASNGAGLAKSQETPHRISDSADVTDQQMAGIDSTPANVVPIGSGSTPSKSVDTNRQPIIDEDVFAEVWSMSQQASEGFYSRLVEKYDQGSHEDLVVLEAAIGEGDAELVSSRAHRLKSSSANWGGRRVADLCQALETSGKNNQLDHAMVFFKQVVREHKLLLNTLRERDVKAA